MHHREQIAWDSCASPRTRRFTKITPILPLVCLFVHRLASCVLNASVGPLSGHYEVLFTVSDFEGVQSRSLNGPKG